MTLQHPPLLPPLLFFSLLRPPPSSTLFPYTTLFRSSPRPAGGSPARRQRLGQGDPLPRLPRVGAEVDRSEDHTSELQSQSNLVCRLLLEKKKKRDHAEGNSGMGQDAGGGGHRVVGAD